MHVSTEPILGLLSRLDRDRHQALPRLQSTTTRTLISPTPIKHHRAKAKAQIAGKRARGKEGRTDELHDHDIAVLDELSRGEHRVDVSLLIGELHLGVGISGGHIGVVENGMQSSERSAGIAFEILDLVSLRTITLRILIPTIMLRSIRRASSAAAVGQATQGLAKPLSYPCLLQPRLSSPSHACPYRTTFFYSSKPSCLLVFIRHADRLLLLSLLCFSTG
jgi:hypothetical protein